MNIEHIGTPPEGMEINLGIDGVTILWPGADENWITTRCPPAGFHLCLDWRDPRGPMISSERSPPRRPEPPEDVCRDALSGPRPWATAPTGARTAPDHLIEGPCAECGKRGATVGIALSPMTMIHPGCAAAFRGRLVSMIERIDAVATPVRG